MRCLTDVELQTLADGEASQRRAAEMAEHIAACARCRSQLEGIRGATASLSELMDRVDAAAAPLGARLRQTIASRDRVRGATTLRGPVAAPAWRRRVGVVSAIATPVVVAVFVFVVLPRLDAPTTLSAAQILGRSLQTLSATQGVELLEYEVVCDDIAHGTWRIEQLIDHERPTHFRVAGFDADGVLRLALSQDPVRQRRSQLVRSDDRNYIVNVGSLPSAVLSLPQMVQALVETAVTMMQATSDQKLTVVDGPNGQQYVIEIPAVTPAQTAATLELHRGRAVIDASEFRIREIEVAGMLLRQPFSVSFKLIRRTVRPASAVQAAEFEIHPGPNDVILEGTAAEEPLVELVTTILRELTRARAL